MKKTPLPTTEAGIRSELREFNKILKEFKKWDKPLAELERKLRDRYHNMAPSDEKTRLKKNLKALEKTREDKYNRVIAPYKDREMLLSWELERIIKRKKMKKKQIKKGKTKRRFRP